MNNTQRYIIIIILYCKGCVHYNKKPASCKINKRKSICIVVVYTDYTFRLTKIILYFKRRFFLYIRYMYRFVKNVFSLFYNDSDSSLNDVITADFRSPRIHVEKKNNEYNYRKVHQKGIYWYRRYFIF